MRRILKRRYAKRRGLTSKGAWSGLDHSLAWRPPLPSSHVLEVEMTVGRVFSVMSLLAMLTAVAAALASGG
jgi:hypothetical protein